MAKTEKVRQQCTAKTASGNRCSRMAWAGLDVCGLHGAKDQAKETKSRARERGIDDDFSPHFRELLDLCRREIANPSEKTNHLQQWGRLQLDIVRNALEHQRLLEGAGAHVAYEVHIHQPEPTPIPDGLEDQEEPLSASEGQGETVH